MNPIPWKNKQRESGPEPASPLATLRGEMDRLFDAFVREPFGAIDWPFAGQGKWSPAVDVAETDQEITVRAELPGIDPKDLDVTVTGGQLVLSGEKRESTEDRGDDFYHTDSRFGSFRRVVRLPEGVDSENVEAEFVNGVLTMRLKKSPAAVPKRIDVKVK